MAASARGVTNDPRDIAIYLARTLKGDSLKQIGEHFSIEKYSTVGCAIARVKKKIQTDQMVAMVARKIEQIIKALDKSQRKT